MYKIDNAVKTHKEYPKTFHLPLLSDITKLKVGDIVKMIFSEEGQMSERMWVEITNIDGNDYTGVLDSHPFKLTTIKRGDVVQFKSQNITDIYED